MNKHEYGNHILELSIPYGVELLGLRNIPLKKSYDSDSDNILTDFYIPALSNSVQYKRLTGFFSSSTLAIAAKGVSKLISNGGNMKLVTGARFRKADIEAIKEAYERPERVIEGIMLKELDDLEGRFIEDHVRALGWMVANKKLEIKVAIILDEEGYPLEEKTLEKKGIFHQKVGILEDAEGNRLSFSGSENESASGWLSNIEEFKVFRSWMEPEKDYLEADLDKFQKFWTGYPKRAQVMDIPNAVKKRLIEIAPDDIEELDLDRWLTYRRRIRLKDFQKGAVNSWLTAGKKGIFEMATGTGKTICALECLAAAQKTEKRLVTVITVPYVHLAKQWIREIEKFGIQSEKIIADSSNPGWKDKLADYIFDIINGVMEKLIVLTTHATFSSDDFIELMKRINVKLYLVADEVHGVGAPKRKNGLIENYGFRLGLSATPKRYFDLEGTEELYQYFGDVVFEFSLKKAIEGGFLTPYDYKPYFTELTEAEMMRYEEETARVCKAYYQSKDDDKRRQWFSLLCIRRQDIIKNATNKYSVFKRILDHLSEIKHCLVYCSPQQIDTVQDILNRRSIIQHKFTQIEGTRPEAKYGGISERQFLLKNFSNGKFQALVAMKCLDEGVDIPSAKIAIMLTNSGNPREYVQRRGRVLRRFPGKRYAVIYDIIVIPSLHLDIAAEFKELEKGILLKEFKRYREFALSARNRVECLKKIEETETEYGLLM